MLAAMIVIHHLRLALINLVLFFYILKLTKYATVDQKIRVIKKLVKPKTIRAYCIVIEPV